MRTLLPLILACTISIQLRAQIDTLTHDQRTPKSISEIKESSANNQSSSGFKNSFRNITNLSLHSMPFMTIEELRNGKADSAKVVQITDADLVGIFKLNPQSKSKDDSSFTIVSKGLVYERLLDGAANLKLYSPISGDIASIQKSFDKASLKAEVVISTEIDLGGSILVIPKGLKITFISGGLVKNGRILFKGDNYINADNSRQIFEKINFQIFKQDQFGRTIFSTIEEVPHELTYTEASENSHIVNLRTDYVFHEFGDVRALLDSSNKKVSLSGKVDVRRIENIKPERLGSLVKNKIIHPEWFGCLPDLDIETNEQFQNCVDFQQITAGASIEMSNGIYQWGDRVLSETISGLKIKGCINIYGFLDLKGTSKKGRNSNVIQDSSPNDGSIIIKTNGFRVFRRHNLFHRYTTECFINLRDIRFERMMTPTTYPKGSSQFLTEKKKLQSAHLFHHLSIKSGIIDNVTAAGYGIILNGSLQGVSTMQRCRFTSIYRSIISGRGSLNMDGIYGDDGFHPSRWAPPFTDSFISNNYFNSPASIYTSESCAFEIHGGSRTIISNNFFDFWSTIVSAPLFGSTEGVQFSNNTFDDCYRISTPYHVLVPTHNYEGFTKNYVGGFPGLTWENNNITNHYSQKAFISWHSDEWICWDFSMREAFLDGNKLVKMASPSFSNTTIRNNVIDRCDKILRVKNIAGMYNILETGNKIINQEASKSLSDYVDFDFIGLYGQAKNRNSNYFESYDHLAIDTIPFKSFSGLIPNPQIKTDSKGYHTQSYKTSSDGKTLISVTAPVSKSFDNQTIYVHGVELKNQMGRWIYISGHAQLTKDYLWDDPKIDGLKVVFGNNSYAYKIGEGAVLGGYFRESGYHVETSENNQNWFSDSNVYGTMVKYKTKFYIWNGSYWEDELKPNFISNTSSINAPTKKLLNSNYGKFKAGSVIYFPNQKGGARKYIKLSDDSNSDWDISIISLLP